MERDFQLKNYKPTPFKAPGSIYKEYYADLAVMFVNNLRHTKGSWRGEPFELIDWQERIIRDLFGIIRRVDKCRQFRTAFVEIPKKQGKSELAAAIALLLTCTDNEYGGEIYGCAANRQQASIVFDIAVDMVDQFLPLKRFIKINTAQKKMVFQPLKSFYQVLSADAHSKHGFNPHGIIFDELHSQPNRDLFDVMMQGSADARDQPLRFIITTAGVDRNSICWEMHQFAEDVLNGKKVDDTFYPVIYGAPDDADWSDPEVWKKANPSLGVTVPMENMEKAFEEATRSPHYENQFRQLRLNQWVKQTVRWMNMEKWDSCNFHFDLKQLEKRACYGGLDLSKTTDITALVLVFPPKDEEDKYIVLPFFWIPEESIDVRVRHDHVPYDDWKARKLINTTEGDVIHYAYIEKRIAELGKKYNIKEIAYDRWGSDNLIQNLEGMGFKVTRFGQGFGDMSPATNMLMQLVLEKKLAHAGNPVLRWMADNLVVRTDPAGNIKPDKEKATEKIDGMVALIMALDCAINSKPKKPGRIQVYGADGWM